MENVAAVRKTEITAELVAELIEAQFPKWAGLPITAVEENGWDNNTFRLGGDMLVRLPSGERYVAAVEKEQRWLPYLSESLPVPIPQSLAMGAPGCGYPWPWSIYRWLPGQHATIDRVPDLDGFATEVGAFLNSLYRVDTADGPQPGLHNFFRGGDLSTYDGETRAALAALDGETDVGAATQAWEVALTASWTGSPVWIHGDVHPTNLLVIEGRLNAVIDWGCMAVGDPACDLVIAWSFFSGSSRETFKSALGFDEAAWARARGWALWKSLIWLAREVGNPEVAQTARERVEDLIAEQ
jgi:aminoglycoside phosphotransferase (APT) family kinase protein